MSKDWTDILSESTVEDVLNSKDAEKKKSVLCCDTSAVVPDVFSCLAENNVLSLPVRDFHTNKWIGFVDILDVIIHLINSFSKEELERTDLRTVLEMDSRYESVSGEPIPDLDKQVMKFKSSTVEEILSRTRPFVSIPTTLSALEAANTLCSHGTAIHRACVHLPGDNPVHEFVDILSQWDIIRWMAKQKEHVGKKYLSTTVAELKLGLKRTAILSVNDIRPAIEAFKMMANHNVSGIPVVDDDNKLLGNISASDLKIAYTDIDCLLQLFLPSGEFIKKRERSKLLVTCILSDTVEDVLDQFEKYKIHRIYIVDESSKLVGTVSCIDVLNKILDEL